MKCSNCNKIGYYACVEDKIHKVGDSYKQVVTYQCLCGQLRKTERNL